MATQVVGFKKIKFHTMENVGAGDLSLPENEMHTTAYWLTVPSSLLQALPFASEQRINGLFGLSYLIHHVSPLFMMCDIHDIGVSIGDNSTGETIRPGTSRPGSRRQQEMPGSPTPDFEPNIFIYDNYPGGIGLSPSLFDLEKTPPRPRLKTRGLPLPRTAARPASARPTKAAGTRKGSPARSSAASSASRPPETRPSAFPERREAARAPPDPACPFDSESPVC